MNLKINNIKISITSFSELQDILFKQNISKDDVRSIDCSMNNLIDINWISEFKSLRILKCDNNLIEDFKNIFKDFNKLRNLDCSNNKLTNLDFIKLLPSLETLYCENNKIENFEVLSEMKLLRNISICYTKWDLLPANKFNLVKYTKFYDF